MLIVLCALDCPRKNMTILKYCENCYETEVPLKKCGRCNAVSYCNADCQLKDWPEHKMICKSLSLESNESQRFFKRSSRINQCRGWACKSDLWQKLQAWIKINLPIEGLSYSPSYELDRQIWGSRNLVIVLKMTQGKIEADQILIEQFTKKEQHDFAEWWGLIMVKFPRECGGEKAYLKT